MCVLSRIGIALDTDLLQQFASFATKGTPIDLKHFEI